MNFDHILYPVVGASALVGAIGAVVLFKGISKVVNSLWEKCFPRVQDNNVQPSTAFKVLKGIVTVGVAITGGYVGIGLLVLHMTKHF